MQYKKYKNRAGMNLTPPPPSQNSRAVRWHYTVIIIIIFLLRHTRQHTSTQTQTANN